MYSVFTIAEPKLHCPEKNKQTNKHMNNKNSGPERIDCFWYDFFVSDDLVQVGRMTCRFSYFLFAFVSIDGKIFSLFTKTIFPK